MQEPFESQGVRGVVHWPEERGEEGLVLTHGAGSSADAPLLVSLADAFADGGLAVLRFDLPFRQRRGKGPPFPAMAARDREGIERAVEAMRGLVRGRVYAGGHSYGGRQTSMLAAEHPGLVKALLLLSYPLHPPKRAEQKRTAHFPNLRTAVLFVHGTADGFGTIEELREAAAMIPAASDVLPVEGAGHDLKRAAGLATEILTRLRALAAT